ncbi:hypothetical protein BsWGS_10422 [Bradybaena similaris]
MAEKLLDFNILEQISMLIWAHTGDTRMAVKLAEMKLAAELWKRLSNDGDSDAQVEALRTETVLSISKYVKEHPQASQEELANEVGKQLLEFAKKVEKM